MKFLKPIILSLIIILNMCSPALAQRAITLKVNGEITKTDVAPVIESGRTLIPARAVFEELGAKVEWEPVTKCVTVKYSDTVVMLFAGKNLTVVNTEFKELDVPAKIIDGRTMIPVRFVGTQLGMTVGWDDKTSTVSVIGEKIEPEPIPEPEPEPMPEPEPTPEPTPEPDEIVNDYILGEISVRDTSTRTTITLSGVGKLKPSVINLDNPRRIVFDFENCTLASSASTYKSENSDINGVRSGQFSESVTRIVVDLKKDVPYSTSTSGSNFVISFGNESGNESVESGSYVSPIVLSDAAKEKLLFIDPGHGGSEVGTIGKWNGKEIYEKDVNIKIAKLVNKMLIDNGANTYMVRESDEAIAVTRRPEIANEMGAHFYMSLHNNAAENNSAKGVQICYAETTTKFSDITNKQISNIFYENIASLGLRKAGLLNNPRYIVIYRANMPSIIVESAFMSNPDDLALLMNDDFIVKLAQKICDSALEVLNASAESEIIVPEVEKTTEE